MDSYEELYVSLQLEYLTKSERLRFTFLGISVVTFEEDEVCDLFRNVT
jgi:hypothetical protein